MQLKNPIIAVILAVWLTGCATQTPPNRYELPADEAQPGDSAVAALQREARNALEREEYAKAVSLLQRAIRIEPRNARSWHELAETYWRSGDLRRCAEMVERSQSYRVPGDGLERANILLREKCNQG